MKGSITCMKLMLCVFRLVPTLAATIVREHLILGLCFFILHRPKVGNQIENAQPEKSNLLDADSSVPKYVSFTLTYFP